MSVAESQRERVETRETAVLRYTNGTDIFGVDCGIGGKPWFTYREKNGCGFGNRVKSPALPVRPTREEAQADLDAYAEKKGWREVE